MASTNFAASAYFEQEFERDANFFCIGTCPCGNPGLISKAALPKALECSCISMTAHNWSTIDLVQALKKLAPTKRKTTKQDLLDALNAWLQAKNAMKGASDVKLTFVHVPSPNGSPTIPNFPNGDGDGDSTITLVDGTSSSPASMTRVVIANILNIAKNPLRLVSFGINGLLLVKALARGDAAAALQHIQPFISHFMPQWLCRMNNDFMKEMGAVVQQQNIKGGFGDLQKQLEQMDGLHADAEASGAVNHLNDLQDTLNRTSC
jgi:hypothetical protein